MTENKDNTLQTDLAAGKFRADSPVGVFEYDLSTPWKWQTSLGFVIMKNTAIGIEYELMDYRGINLTDNSGFFNSSQPIIDSIYTLSHHIKFGSEVRIDPFRIRLGYQWQSNPYASITALNSSMHHFSGGIGFRTKKWFTFDAAYMLSIFDGKEIFHQNLTDKIPFQLQSFLHHVSLSVGFNF
jgi:long-subunit fatty acid transport protein